MFSSSKTDLVAYTHAAFRGHSQIRITIYSYIPNICPGLNKRPGGNFVKSNKRPAIYECPGMKSPTEFEVGISLFVDILDSSHI